MAATERISAKRYGVRYGRRLREKIGKIEAEKKRSSICPFCHYKRVSRVSSGIWLCNKCNVKFADRAYFLKSKTEETSIPAKKTVKVGLIHG